MQFQNHITILYLPICHIYIYKSYLDIFGSLWFNSQFCKYCKWRLLWQIWFHQHMVSCECSAKHRNSSANSSCTLRCLAKSEVAQIQSSFKSGVPRQCSKIGIWMDLGEASRKGSHNSKNARKTQHVFALLQKTLRPTGTSTNFVQSHCRTLSLRLWRMTSPRHATNDDSKAFGVQNPQTHRLKHHESSLKLLEDLHIMPTCVESVPRSAMAWDWLQ